MFLRVHHSHKCTQCSIPHICTILSKHSKYLDNVNFLPELRLCHNRCELFLSVIFHVHIYLFLFKNHVVLQIKYFLHKDTLFKCYDFRIPSFIPIHLIISPFLHYIEFLNLTVIFMDIFYFPLSIGLLSAISQGRLTRSFLYFPNINHWTRFKNRNRLLPFDPRLCHFHVRLGKELDSESASLFPLIKELKSLISCYIFRETWWQCSWVFWTAGCCWCRHIETSGGSGTIRPSCRGWSLAMRVWTQNHEMEIHLCRHVIKIKYFFSGRMKSSSVISITGLAERLKWKNEMFYELMKRNPIRTDLRIWKGKQRNKDIKWTITVQWNIGLREQSFYAFAFEHVSLSPIANTDIIENCSTKFLAFS